MNSRELVDRIRNGPAELVLAMPLRFRRRTRSNPCDFNEFQQALQSSETIRSVRCEAQDLLSISEDQWVLLVEAPGRVNNTQHLEFSRLSSFSGNRGWLLTPLREIIPGSLHLPMLFESTHSCRHSFDLITLI
jgi:hypothetical protein